MVSMSFIKQDTWGIIRYAAGSGNLPEDDAAAFDGWYTHREDALAIAKDMRERHPQWIVALVRADLISFGGGDFSSIKYPLTERERKFREGAPG
jgi:hypothetical protein